ncbi:MAG TPA: hypothetical protein VK327_14130 [Candidatus Paceibacterota bacterium]|nr:hypothetical protein [Candidatus Paceibacterota bacterium]
MKTSLVSVALVAMVAMVALMGCSRTRQPEPVFQSLSQPEPIAHAAKTAPETPAQTAPSAALAEALSGKVSTANNDLKFVVLTFPVGKMARVNQHLNVYRTGQKVAEVNVTGPQRQDSIVADITAGEVKPGDEVRDK